MKKVMTELDALEQLSELCEVIDNNNWEHLYSKVDSELTSLAQRLAKENTKLNDEIKVLRELSKDTQQKYSEMKVKLLAFKHLLKEIPEENANS